MNIREFSVRMHGEKIQCIVLGHANQLGKKVWMVRWLNGAADASREEKGAEVPTEEETQQRARTEPDLPTL